jgi:hypothetical protein
VTPTQIKALPYHAFASTQSGLHISILSKLAGASLALGTVSRVNAKPELALALELLSDCQFAGERHAQFIVLMTALEIQIPNTTSKGKRGAVVGFVKDTLAKAGHANAKAVGKELDDLYVARNALVHESKPATDAQLKALKEIVRSTLQALMIDCRWYAMRAVAALIAMLCMLPASAQSTVKIGVLNDQSGPYSAYTGAGSVDAARMAIEDFGGKALVFHPVSS